MKFIAFILSFTMLYMYFLPCGDFQECNVKTEEKISITDNHQQHNHDAEACTPFCVCSCCAASASFTPFAKAQATHVAFQSTKYSLFDVAFNSEVFSSIWQPPQLS